MTGKQGGFCFVHGSKCSCISGADGQQPLQLYAAGFVCKANSVRSNKRWTVSPLSPESSSNQTFDLATNIDRSGCFWTKLDSVHCSTEP